MDKLILLKKILNRQESKKKQLLTFDFVQHKLNKQMKLNLENGYIPCLFRSKELLASPVTYFAR